jgi:predicted DNA binding CopG/RHH family protein
MKRKLPRLKSDRAAAAFVETADLTQYYLGVMAPIRFEFSKKEARVNMRLPSELLSAVKEAASEAGMPYQRFIRHALERAVEHRGTRAAQKSHQGKRTAARS